MPTEPANTAKMALWAAQVERFVGEPPGSDEGLSPESIERESKVTFSQFSTWSIVCEEVLDTQYARVYFERAREELHRRGITDAEMTEMRRFAWLTAGWLNFERGRWEWCNLDEQDIYQAIEWQHADGYIAADERDRRIAYAKRYDQQHALVAGDTPSDEGEQMENDQTPLAQSYFHEAEVESGGRTIRLTSAECRALEHDSKAWYGPSEPSVRLAVETFLLARRRVAGAGDLLALELAAKALGITTNRLRDCIYWHESHMQWLVDDPDYKVL